MSAINGRKPAFPEAFEDPESPTNKSKAEIQALKDSVVKIGGTDFKAPETVLQDSIALAKWLEIMDLYKSAETQLDIFTMADVGLVERYALAHADFVRITFIKNQIYEKYSRDIVKALAIIQHLNLDRHANNYTKILLKMEPELLLTPLSKRRALPRINKPKKKKTALEQAGFSDV